MMGAHGEAEATMRGLLAVAVLMGCRTDKGAAPGEETVGLETAVDADGDGYDETEDCDDGSSLVSPAAAEICDGFDNDCDGEADEGVTSVYYGDADADGFGGGEAAQLCEAQDGYSAVGTDCDDAEPAVYPGAAEVCDGADNDCDGEADEEGGATWHPDADGDGFGDDGAAAAACAQPAGYVADNSDCDDTDAASFPGGVEVCDEADNDCDGDTDEGAGTAFYVDTDGDGYGVEGAATEACDLPTGYAAVSGDCDDGEDGINPDAAEICDGADNDCDGAADEAGAADAPAWYADADGDGFGDGGAAAAACAQPAGYVADNSDCDDGSAAVSPAGTEVCGGADEDCDGQADEASAADAPLWYADADGDGYGEAGGSQPACAQPAGYVADNSDCDDEEPAANPGEAEACDEIDNDCDGLEDEGVESAFYADGDGDGYGNPGLDLAGCAAPEGFVGDASDCDDGEAENYPGAAEICDGEDNDCDGEADEAGAAGESAFYADSDGDGYGDAGEGASACDAPAGYVEDDEDCDDSDPAINPGMAEICGTGDLDCDGYAPDLCGSCLEILEAGASTGDGLYSIDLASVGEVETWCDMTTDGGGWTLVQRTVWDWDLSGALLTGYATWYSSTLGDPGAAFRLAGEGWEELNVQLDHLLVHAARDKSSGGDCDPLYYLGEGGEFSITGAAATLTGLSATVTMVNSESLSTTDSGPSAACAATPHYGVPWFYSTCCNTCPTFDNTYWSDEPHPMASYIDTAADLYGQTAADVCPSGAALPNENGSSYEGINAMEYYLR